MEAVGVPPHELGALRATLLQRRRVRWPTALLDGARRRRRRRTAWVDHGIVENRPTRVTRKFLDAHRRRASRLASSSCIGKQKGTDARRAASPMFRV